MSQFSLLSKPTTLPFNPIHCRKLPVNLRSSGGGSSALCFGGGFVTGGASKIDLVGTGSYGLICGRRCEELFLRNENRKEGAARGGRIMCTAAVFNPQTLHWVSAVASVVLMFSKGTTIQKSFLAPLFALQAPTSVMAWLKGDYGTWTALLGLLVRLFYSIPAEVELPFVSMLMAIVAPTQTMNLRGTPAAAIISLVIAGYLAYQHFSKTGTLENAFDSGPIVATLALVCALAVPCLLLFIY